MWCLNSEVTPSLAERCSSRHRDDDQAARGARRGLGSFRFTVTLLGRPDITIETRREAGLIEWLRTHRVQDAEMLVQQLKEFFSVDVLEHG